MTTADEVLMMSRMYLMEHAVYFSKVALSLIPHPEPRIPTLGVTPGMVLYYNPEYMAGLTEAQGGTRLWHEVQHVLRHSFTRLEGVDDKVANQCEDLAINSSGRHNAAWDFSPDGLLPANHGLPEDLTAEEYYHLLPPQGLPQTGVCGGQCGGVAGTPIDADIEAELDALYGRDEVDIENIKEQTAMEIEKHEKKGRGKIPGGWGEWAKGILAPPKVPWQQYFQHTVRAVSANVTYGDSDYSMSRPSRRSYAMPPGPFRPGLVGEEVEFALILDTSGSMSMEKDIKPMLREARGAILASGAESAWFIQCDSALSTNVVRVRARDLEEVKVQGRGGTDFRPGVEAAVKLKPKPCIVIYFTDGEGPAPERQPEGIEFIWCISGKGRKAPASWGHVINVTD